MLFDATSRTMLVANLSGPIQGAQVNLIAALEWCIREMRLHQLDGIGGNLQTKKLDFNLKLDGRPFWGKNNLVPRICMEKEITLVKVAKNHVEIMD